MGYIPYNAQSVSVMCLYYHYTRAGAAKAYQQADDIEASNAKREAE